MTALTHLTMAEALDGLAKKEFTAVELTEAHVRAVEAVRPFNIFITETPDAALSMAKASDERRAKGEAGPMDGLPIAVKDLFCTKGVATTAGSHILDGFKPEYESTVTSQLWRDGAVMLGKVNLDEFAMGSATITAHQGETVSPWSPGAPGAWEKKIVSGGSSGGSAAVIAARAALGATGTDTGGSIRQPAGYTGTVGIKPTYGRCSRWGIVAYASSLDQAGPMTRTVEDAAIMLRSMCGFDPKDSTSVDMPVPDFRAALTGDIRGLRVGIPKEYRVEGLSAEIAALWDQGIAWLKEAGAEPVEVSLPHTEYALPVYYIIAPAEASDNLARYDGIRFGARVDRGDMWATYKATRGQGFGAEVKRRIMLGTYALSAGYYDAYYAKAQQVRTLIKRDFDEAFEQVDIIAAPTTPKTAFRFGENTGDPLQMYLEDVFTLPASLAGVPGLSVPCGFNGDGLPIGLQLIAPSLREDLLLRVGHSYEQSTEWHKRAPEIAL